MARYPGTEVANNRAGFRPGEPVRCRRSQANAARGVADARGFVAEVRPGHVRLVLDMNGRGVWLQSVDVLAENDLGNADLEILRRAYSRLGGQRLEAEDDVLIVFGPGYPASHLEDVRRMLGDRLSGLDVAPHGVHELATHLRLKV